MHFWKEEGHGLQQQLAANDGCALEHDDMFYQRRRGLRHAIADGKIKTASQLLRRGIHLNCTNEEGQTVLHIAAACGDVELAKDLVQCGAFFDVQDARGRSPLYMAADSGHLPAVLLFIKLGADVNKPSTDGWTPMHAAASKGYTEALVALVGCPTANLNREDRCGQTPLALAQRQGNSAIAELLQALGQPGQEGPAEEGRDHFFRHGDHGQEEANDDMAGMDDGVDPADWRTVIWSFSLSLLCFVIREAYLEWLKAVAAGQ